MTQWAGRGGQREAAARRRRRLPATSAVGECGRGWAAPRCPRGMLRPPRSRAEDAVPPRPPGGVGRGMLHPPSAPLVGQDSGGSTLFASPRGWSTPPVGLGRWGFATRCPPGGAGRGMLCPAVPRGRGCLSPGLLCLPPRYPVEAVSESRGVLSSPVSLGLSLTWGHVILTPELGCRGDLLSPDITPRPGN